MSDGGACWSSSGICCGAGMSDGGTCWSVSV